MAIETLAGMVAAGERATEASAARFEREMAYEQEISDGFLSTWAEGLTAQKGALAAEIIAQGGTAYFWRMELIDAETGELIEGAKLIEGQYGPVWMMRGAAEARYGRFITAHAKREATMARKGVRERITIFSAAATADLRGAPGAKGMSGASTVRAIVRPEDTRVEYTGLAGIARAAAERWMAAGHFGWQQMVMAA